MSTIAITDRDDHLRCGKCDEVITGDYDPVSGMLRLRCPQCREHVEGKLYSGEPNPKHMKLNERMGLAAVAILLVFLPTLGVLATMAVYRIAGHPLHNLPWYWWLILILTGVI